MSDNQEKSDPSYEENMRLFAGSCALINDAIGEVADKGAQYCPEDVKMKLLDIHRRIELLGLKDTKGSDPEDSLQNSNKKHPNYGIKKELNRNKEG